MKTSQDMPQPDIYHWNFLPDVHTPVEFDPARYQNLYDYLETALLTWRNGQRAEYLQEQAVETLSLDRQVLIASLGSNRCGDTIDLLGRLASHPPHFLPKQVKENARYRVGQMVMSNFDSFAAVAEGDDSVVAAAATDIIFESVDVFGMFGDDDAMSRQSEFIIGRLRSLRPDDRQLGLVTSSVGFQ
ncbi:MAG TPA: hypothetical protein VL737_03925, partial [Candidatus Pristimantibacillus sp.]|nr:hypothetical protein [Candidatus Pristimantibacillus sp.]